MDHIPSWFGTDVGDRDGEPVGVVLDVYYDQASWRPAWLLVETFDKLALVPARGVRSRRGAVLLAHERAVIDASPAIARPPEVLAGEPLLRLARHYGVRVDRSGAHAAVNGAAAFRRAA